jgi:membrane protease YdiL (CAAX protease family)
MRGKPPRRKPTFSDHALLWSALVLVPATKTWQLISGKPRFSDVDRQVAIALALAVATAWTLKGAEPVPSAGKMRWLIAVGLWPDCRPGADHRWQAWRWVLAFVGLIVALVATLPLLEAWGRWLCIALGAVALLTVGILELARHVQWKRAQSTRCRPNRTLLWIIAPLTISGLGTATALGARGIPGELDLDLLTELVLVTALGEEFIFRGCMLVLAYRALQPWAAEAVVALSYGAWHIGNAWTRSRGEVAGSRAAQIVGTVLVTAIAGLIFSFLRRRSGSLAGPVLAHVGVNLPGTALA